MEAAMPEKVNSQISIDRAMPQDAEVICDIRDRAWLESYPNDSLGITKDDIRMNAQGPNGEFVPRRIAYLKQQFAQNDHTGLRTYVAKVDNKIVGYTDPRIDEQGRKCIGAMYVAPEFQGCGVGGVLMRKALDVLGRDEDIYLEVVSYNNKAVGFYEHFGFQKTDALVPREEGRPDYLTDIPQIEMVLHSDPKV